MKSSVAEIRARFDNDVERFANLETGQSATVDAPLVLELIARCRDPAPGYFSPRYRLRGGQLQPQTPATPARYERDPG